MIGEESSCIKEKPSLLKKYDLTLDNLSYEYVKKCTDVKALERIIKILRSGEEGSFPELLLFAEEHLKYLCPGNRLLIKPEPIPSLSSLDDNDRNKISYEMASWSEEMKRNESLLRETDNKGPSNIPPIRSYGETINIKETTNAKKKNSSIKSLDYEAWEKYDPDKEIMKMEIEEERKREELTLLMEKKRMENNPDTLTDLGHYSDLEKQEYSTKEKNLGNEFFNAGQYEEATHYYTRSISILPNVAAYNNRAIANLKLKKYGEVILDCNEVLKRDTKNVKALFRRGNAHESKGFYSEAIKDFECVLELDPNHSLARNHVSDLKKKLEETNEGKPKKARMVVEDMKSFEEELKSIQIFDKNNHPSICPKPSIPTWRGSYSCDPMSSGDRKLNEWGYPRVVCNCSSTPRALQKKHIPHPKDPGKGSIQVANKYSSVSGSKFLHRYENMDKISNHNHIRDKDSEARVHSNSGSSCHTVQPLRDMPLLTTSNESAPATIVSGQLLDSTEDKYLAVDVEMQNSNDQPMEISKDYDYFKEVDSRCDSSSIPNCRFLWNTIWNEITEDEDLSKHAFLLKKISPSNLSTAIGDKLEGDSLSKIIACLNSNHFKDDDKLLLDFLIAISQLPRFPAVVLFLSTPEKNVVKSLFEKLEESGELQVPDELKNLYELR